MLTKLYLLGQTNEKGFNRNGHRGPKHDRLGC